MTKTKAKIPQVKIVQKEEAALVPVNDAEAFQLMDRRDEEQIVAALEGKYLDEYVYSFQQGGKSVEGLSWLGVQEAARAYGGIQCSIEKMKIDRTDKEIIVMVEAFDEQTKSSAIGASSQAVMMKTSRGIMEDSFALQKAISKAQRNAKRQLLPQSLLRQWIEKHRKAKSNGNNGSNKSLLDNLYAAVAEKGLDNQYIVQKMDERYRVKSSSQLSTAQIKDFIDWVTFHGSKESQN